MEKIGLNELCGEIESLKGEISDLKLMLEAVTGHSDGMEADLMEQSVRGKDCSISSAKQSRYLL